MQDGELPTFRSLVEQGTGRPVIVDQLNCQTPAALATLFTGTGPERHGIGGFYSPNDAPGSSLLGCKNSFAQNSIQLPLFWETVAGCGGTVSMAHIPFSERARSSRQEQYRCIFNGYPGRLERGTVIRMSDLTWEKATLPLTDEGVNAEGKTTTVVLGKHAIRLDYFKRGARECFRVSEDHDEGGNGRGHNDNSIECVVNQEYEWTGNTLLFDSNTTLGVYAFSCEDKDDIAIVFSGLHKITAVKNNDINRFIGHTGAFLGESVGRYYRSGYLGIPKRENGPGYAEERFLQNLGYVNEYCERVVAYCLSCYPADLAIFYLPTADEAGHEFMGYADPSCSLYDHPHALEYRRLLGRVYRGVDALVGRIKNRISSDTCFVVSSDHGMAGCSRSIFINELLRREGLLEFHANGEINLGKTRAFYHPAENGAFIVNAGESSRKNISDTDKMHTLLEVWKLLTEYVDPDSRQKIIKNAVVVDKDLSGGHELWGDLFLIPSDEYSLKSGINSGIFSKTPKTGTHHFYAGRPCMQGVMVSSESQSHKKGIQAAVKNTDIKSMLCGLMDIPIPGEGKDKRISMC
jgi:predicted AlkP superfamily phosphohydrolase/phosphomutase